jgi:hypothetical protein
MSPREAIASHFECDSQYNVSQIGTNDSGTKGGRNGCSKINVGIRVEKQFSFYKRLST